MTTIAVHMTVAEWRASTTEQKRYLMSRFWSKTQEVPEHIGILPHICTTPVSHSVPNILLHYSKVLSQYFHLSK